VILRDSLAAALTAGFRTRFAPAPTGRLHLGHAVNMVWVWSVARAFGGAILLRIEDHDRSRWRPEFEREILDVLDWLELAPDAMPTTSPRQRPPWVIRQSDRTAAYLASLAVLEAEGRVYPCQCSRRAIAALVPHDASTEPRYPGTCRAAELDGAMVAARRLRLEPEWITFIDLVQGAQRQCPAEQCGDLLLRDRAGQWTYQFAVVVDDLEQEIDLIIRGTDLLASTGRQLQLRALLRPRSRPVLLHHPLIRHPDGTKLSKSRGDSGLFELREAGWSPARVLGHAAFRAGLQSVDRPLPASALPTLWER
jgi:glutamyl-Q tRNA(Asp) synthetase